MEMVVAVLESPGSALFELYEITGATSPARITEIVVKRLHTSSTNIFLPKHQVEKSLAFTSTF